MPNIDQFESAFKAADKTLFAPESVSIKSVLVITDVDQTQSKQFADRSRHFMNVLEQDSVQWSVLDGDQFASVGELLQKVEQHQADLICTYRNLTSEKEHAYSLGVHVDVLAQVTAAPVLLLPHPRVLRDNEELLNDTKNVMAITDHLTGDHHLVSYAARMTADHGTLFLTHVEDETTFERYMETIGKIPTMDTESAREELIGRLLKEPRDYIKSCRKVLQQAGAQMEVEDIVMLGHRLADYERLIKEQSTDLLVLNTKDENQLAMHGQAYPLTVELRETAMLLL